MSPQRWIPRLVLAGRSMGFQPVIFVAHQPWIPRLVLAGAACLACAAPLPAQSFESRLPHVPIRLVQAAPRAPAASQSTSLDPAEAGFAEYAPSGGSHEARGGQQAIPLEPPSSDATRAGQPLASSFRGGALVTVAGSLAVVLGAFFLLVWFARKSLPQPASGLPREAFEVLGQAPLHGRQMAQVLKVGNKILLVALTAGEARTLTEITDATEVERLATACRRGPTHGVAAALRQALGPSSPVPGAATGRGQPANRSAVRRRFAVEV